MENPNKTLEETIKYLRRIEIYLKGENCYELSPSQVEENLEFYHEAIRLQKQLLQIKL